MKIALILIGVVVGLVLAVIVIGALLPKHHTVARSAAFRAKPERLYELISGPPTWRPEVKKYEPLPSSDGKQAWNETDSHGQTIAYEVVERKPPELFRTRIATTGLPYAGTWTYQLHEENGSTVLRITEDGDVYNPVFRFVSHLILGQATTINAYLGNLAKAVGEQVQIEGK